MAAWALHRGARAGRADPQGFEISLQERCSTGAPPAETGILAVRAEAVLEGAVKTGQSGEQAAIGGQGQFAPTKRVESGQFVQSVMGAGRAAAKRLPGRFMIKNRLKGR